MRNKKLIILFSVLLSITLLVVFNSVLFSVQHIDAYCANVQDSALKERVLSVHTVKRGSSIFFVNKGKVTAAVEQNVPGVRVLNVEKKFPNRIYINYVEVKEYLKVTDGTQTYFFGNDMRVIRTVNGLGTEAKAIRLRYSGTLPVMQAGDTLAFTTPNGLSAAAVVSEIFAGLERLGYYDTVIDLFTEIDLTGNFIVLTTSTGMKWEIITADNLPEKMRFALSVYFSDKLTDAQKSAGTLIVTGASSASYRGVGGGVENVS